MVWLCFPAHVSGTTFRPWSVTPNKQMMCSEVPNFLMQSLFISLLFTYSQSLVTVNFILASLLEWTLDLLNFRTMLASRDVWTIWYSVVELEGIILRLSSHTQGTHFIFMLDKLTTISHEIPYFDIPYTDSDKMFIGTN